MAVYLIAVMSDSATAWTYSPPGSWTEENTGSGLTIPFSRGSS